MAVKVAINGFGRIGRLAFRQMFDAEGYEVVAINDLTSPKMLAYLLKYDSSQGKYAHADTVEAGEDYITVNGKKITIYKEPDASKLPWGELDVDVVLECTGFYTSKAKAEAHVAAGAKKVVISAPAGSDLKTIVFNGYTGDQMLLDGPQRKGNLRRSRAAAVNIVPTSTGAAKAIGLVIPELNGKLIGSAVRVPVPTGSTTVLTAVVKGTVTVDEVNAAMKAAATDSFGYNEDEIVSSDIVGMTYGSLFDATQTMVNALPDGNSEVQVVSWYDNENSFTSNMVKTIKYFSELA